VRPSNVFLSHDCCSAPFDSYTSGPTANLAGTCIGFPPWRWSPIRPSASNCSASTPARIVGAGAPQPHPALRIASSSPPAFIFLVGVPAHRATTNADFGLLTHDSKQLDLSATHHRCPTTYSTMATTDTAMSRPWPFHAATSPRTAPQKRAARTGMSRPYYKPRRRRAFASARLTLARRAVSPARGSRVNRSQLSFLNDTCGLVLDYSIDCLVDTPSWRATSMPSIPLSIEPSQRALRRRSRASLPPRSTVPDHHGASSRLAPASPRTRSRPQNASASNRSSRASAPAARVCQTPLRLTYLTNATGKGGQDDEF